MSKIRPSDPSIKARVSEVFSSFQGEGPYAGVRQVFVRFFECHMHCAWCDTPDSIGDGRKDFKEFTLTQLNKKVKALLKDCHSVSLTGGEPLMQADFIKAFIPLLKPAPVKVYLETSGVLHGALEKIIQGVDIVSMDIKLPSSTKCRPFWREHELFLKTARAKDVFVKTVIASGTVKEDIEKAVRLIARVDRTIPFILQPNTFDLSKDVVKKCAGYYDYCLKYLSDVRILPQMHKFLKVR